MSQPCSLRN